MRGDTDFSQTKHLDRWNDDGRVTFIFGFDAKPNLKDIAEDLPANAWQNVAASASSQTQDRGSATIAQRQSGPRA